MQNVLKQIREQRGMGVAELARKSGLARQTIYNIESDPQRVVDSKTMEALALALRVKVNKIFLF